MSALTRGATTSGSAFISSASLAAVASSTLGSEPESMTEISRPVPAPPCCEVKLTRASGKAASCGASARSNSMLERLRSALSVMKMRALPSCTFSIAISTSGWRAMSAATRSATASVCRMVVPGTISMLIRLKSLS